VLTSYTFNEEIYEYAIVDIYPSLGDFLISYIVIKYNNVIVIY